MKFASRPGRHDRDALPQRREVEEPLPLGERRRRQRLRIGNARGVVVALEAHIAAERDRGELPARAAAIGEAGKLAAEADREGGDANSAPAGDEEMPHLVHEDDGRQHDQRRDDVAGEDPAESGTAHPSRSLGCLQAAADRRLRSARAIRRADGIERKRLVDRGRPGQQSLGFGGRQGNFHDLGDCGEADPVGEKRLDRHFVRGIQDGRRAAALLQRLHCEAERRKALRIRALERELPDGGKVERRHRLARALRPVQAIADRAAHVGRSELGMDGSVAEGDQRVHDRLRMHERRRALPARDRTDDAPR